MPYLCYLNNYNIFLRESSRKPCLTATLIPGFCAVLQQVPARPVHHLGAAVRPDGEAHKMEMEGTTTRCIPETEADAYKQHRPGPL